MILIIGGVSSKRVSGIESALKYHVVTRENGDYLHMAVGKRDNLTFKAGVSRGEPACIACSLV